MKKLLPLLYLFLLSTSASGAFAANPTKVNKSDSIYKSVSTLYQQRRISADSVINIGVYHKAGNLKAAESCLKLVATDNNPKALMELGNLYAFTPEFASKAAEGVNLLQQAARLGNNDANAYLGLYYYNHNDLKKAKAYFDACNPLNFGFGYAALGGMYLTGKGVKKDKVKVRENYRQSAMKGYARGMGLYGHNLLTKTGGKIDYPEAFFWIYMAGELGDDNSRVTLYRPRVNESFGDTEAGKGASEALQWIEMVHKGKSLKNEPVYKNGFLPGLKDKEKAADQGDDWARFYLGSMNYNGDFLNQNFARAALYYEPIAKNGKLPRPLLALVNYRLAEMYRDGKGVTVNRAKAAQYARQAAKYGSISAYKMVE